MRDRSKRLRRLMALASDQAGTPEGVLAARLAQELMDDQRAALQGLDPQRRDTTDPFIRQPLVLGGRAHWRRRVASITARHCDCLCSFIGADARLSGRRSAVQVAAYLYQVMSRSVTLQQVAWLGTSGQLDNTRAANDFAHSAVLALESRLKALRRVGTRDPQTTALVRTDARQLRRWLTAQGVRLRPEPPFPFAYSQEGYAAGHRVPLRRAVETD